MLVHTHCQYTVLISGKISRGVRITVDNFRLVDLGRKRAFSGNRARQISSGVPSDCPKILTHKLAVTRYVPTQGSRKLRADAHSPFNPYILTSNRTLPPHPSGLPTCGSTPLPLTVPYYLLLAG